MADLVVTIVPNWNLKDDLSECLESLQRIAYAPHLVVVVDNGSIDGSVAHMRATYPWAHVIALPQNRGYAAALNAGIAYAQERGAAYIFALNNDTIVPPDTLSALIHVCESHAGTGIVAPKVLYYDQPDRIFSLGDRMYPFLPVPVGFGYRWRNHPRFARLMEFDYVTGCAMLIPMQVIRQVGLFDTMYFMYYEDGDFCRRVRNQGYRIFCDGRAVIYHKASLSAKKEQIQTCRLRARNRVRFYRRYHHGPHPWLTYGVLALVALWRSAAYLARGQPQLVRPYLQGLLEGWREPLPAPRYTWAEERAL